MIIHYIESLDWWQEKLIYIIFSIDICIYKIYYKSNMNLKLKKMEKKLKTKVNLCPIYYNILVQLSMLRNANETIFETIQRVISDKFSSTDDKLLANWIREYCDNIPYEKKVREDLLNKILPVIDINSINKIPFVTTKYGHKSNVYQAINTKKLIEELIGLGIYPQYYFQSKTKWRGANLSLSQEEKDSREMQVVTCSDHFTLKNSNNNHVFLEIARKTGLDPKIEVRNAHTGKNACFLIISMVNSEFRSFGLRSRYHKDSLFGVRIEHRDLGENYNGLYSAIEKLTSNYSKLLDIIVSMQSNYLSLEKKEFVQKELKTIIFGKSPENYECDLSYLFDTKFEDRLSLWDRMLFIQKNLYNEIPYIYTNKDGKKISLKKKLKELKWTSSQKIIGKLFELFESVSYS